MHNWFQSHFHSPGQIRLNVLHMKTVRLFELSDFVSLILDHVYFTDLCFFLSHCRPDVTEL